MLELFCNLKIVFILILLYTLIECGVRRIENGIYPQLFNQNNPIPKRLSWPIEKSLRSLDFMVYKLAPKTIYLNPSYSIRYKTARFLAESTLTLLFSMSSSCANSYLTLWHESIMSYCVSFFSGILPYILRINIEVIIYILKSIHHCWLVWSRFQVTRSPFIHFFRFAIQQQF